MIRTYANAMRELQSLEQLSAIEAASVPHMTPDLHRETIRRHVSAAGLEERAVPASDADLTSIGIQVEHVPKRGEQR